MRHRFQSLSLMSLCCLAASVGGAFAQAKSPFMEGYPFQYEGQIGGLDAWSLPEQEDLWLVLPDGQTVIAGFVFNGRGNDVGAALLGVEPMSATESLQMMFEATPGDNQASTLPAEAPSSGEATVTPTATAEEADPEAMVAEMIAELDASKSPEEFQAVLQRYALLLKASPEAPPSAPADTAPAVSVEPDETDDAAVVQAAAPKPENPEQFLSMIADGSFWFSVGVDGADPVYMFYDPACPHCARAIRNLEPRVTGGEVQLRLIPVPVISQASLGLVAGIFEASDPAAAVLENARQLAGQGKTSIIPGDPAAMNQDHLSGIQSNMDLAGDLELPGVPFFAWSAASGPKFLSGVPAMNYDFGIRLP